MNYAYAESAPGAVLRMEQALPTSVLPLQTCGPNGKIRIAGEGLRSAETDVRRRFLFLGGVRNH